MLIVFFKSIFVFLLVLLVMRIMGKRQLGEMQPFELVITLIIAEVACIPMNDPYIPFYNGIIPILTLTVLHIVISFFARKSVVLRKLISGSPIIVVDKNGINYKNLKKMNINLNDLIESLRSSGYVDFALIQYAIFETNGKLCIVEKPSAKDSKDAFLPLPIVVDGDWVDENLATCGATKPLVISRLKNGLKVKDILLIDIRQDGSMYISPKYQPCYDTKISISGGNNW